MRALTLLQPWADAIVCNSKRVENRTWSPPASQIGKLICIHAGKAWDEIGDTFPNGSRVFEPDSYVRGAIIGTARLLNTVGPDDPLVKGDPWAFGPRCWRLDRVRWVRPVAARGMQGLWAVPGEIQSLVRADHLDRYGQELEA